MTKSISMRAIAVSLAVTTAIWMVGATLIVPTALGASDTTLDQLLAQIADLQAQVLALQGGGGSGGCYAFSQDLTIGSNGADVTALQDYLTTTGDFTFSGGSTGYFGPITQSAVASWQASNGVAPAVGYFGPISRAQYNSVCTPGDDIINGGDDNVGDLEGEEGTFRNFELLGDPSSETVYEGDDQNVLGWVYEAQDSDLRTERVRVRFDGTAGGTDKPWKILDEVCLFNGTDEVACEDANSSSDWSEATTNIYEKTFAGLTEITREGDESQFFVNVRTLDTIDSNEDNTVWTVSIEANGVRAEDAAGEDVTGPSTSGVITETFTLDTDPQGSLELTIDSDKNEARVVDVDATNNTADVVLLTWSQEVKEGPVTVTDLAVDVTSANSGTGSVGDLLASIDLYRDGTKVKTESITSSAVDPTITFDNIDLTQQIGTEEWMIKGKVKNLDGSTFVAADGVNLNIGNSDVTAEAANNDTVTATGGTITGGDVVFYDEGIQVAFVDASATKTVEGSGGGVDDEGSFIIRFDVTAFGSDIWVPDGATSTTAAAGGNAGASYALTVGTVSATQTNNLASNGTAGSNSSFKVGKGNTQRFTMTTSVTAATGTTDFVKTALDGILWSTTDKATGTSVYDFNLSKYKTDSITLVPR